MDFAQSTVCLITASALQQLKFALCKTKLYQMCFVLVPKKPVLEFLMFLEWIAGERFQIINLASKSD